jgi:hypothetical protein
MAAVVLPLPGPVLMRISPRLASVIRAAFREWLHSGWLPAVGAIQVLMS